ncbi:MAG: cobalt-precorrin 5A hydrolase [archaeon]|nr:cobalt-precorrin 5A hydrolase [archaeon]
MKVWIIAFTTNGCRTAKRIAEHLSDENVSLFAKSTSDEIGIAHVDSSMREWTKSAFAECDAIVFVGAIGIAVREIAPFVRSKDVDPAVISVDEKGRFSVPVLSGHIGGANPLAVRIAGGIGAVPVVTTATDINGKIAIDSFAVTHDLTITDLHAAKDIAARILAGDPVGLVSDVPLVGEVPPELTGPADSPSGVYIGEKDVRPFPMTLRLVPRNRVLGIGCRRDTPQSDIEEMVAKALETAGVSMDTVRACASIDLKKDEKGLLGFASDHRLPITFYTSEELNALEGDFSRSDFVRSITAVDCVCERSAVKVSRNGRIILRKFAGNGVTVAIVEEDFSVDMGKGRK